MNKNITPISDYAHTTLLGMNGGCPESPDGKHIVYSRKANLETNIQELWLCDIDLANHRKLLDAQMYNHNGLSATFVDNNRVVFRSSHEGSSKIYILNIYTAMVEYTVSGKEGHRAEQNKFPYNTSEAVYWLDCDTGKVVKIFENAHMVEEIVKAGYIPSEHTVNMSHMQLNPAITKVMMRIGVSDVNCKGGALLGGYDLQTGRFDFIPNKPVHQLWYDNDSYMAITLLQDGTPWERASRIDRYAVTGEILENLGGVGNHIDSSPCRQFFVGESLYRGGQIELFLYKKGVQEPLAVLDSHNFQIVARELKVHMNPSFSTCGKRIYYNRPVSEGRSVAMFADISEYV